MKMFYSAYTNKGNVGDLLITKYQIEEYAKYGEVYVDCHGMPDGFRKVVFDTVTPNIKDFEAEFGMTYRSKKIIKVISLLNKNSFSHFCNCPGPRESLCLPLKTMCFKIMGAIIPAVFLNRKIKRYSLGVDVNYTDKGILKVLNIWYFSRFNVLGIRSKANLHRIEHSLKNTIYVPDMAFLYPYFSPELYNQTNNRIAISFREVDGYDRLIKVLSIIGRIANEFGVGIDIVYQVDEDKPMCEKLLKDINTSVFCLNNVPVNYYSLAKYQKYDIVISNRLHVLLMAALNGAVPYGLISYDENEQKIQELFESVFGEQYVTYIDDFCEESFVDFYKSIRSLKKEVCQKVEKQRNVCHQTFRTLFQLQ